MNTPSAPLRLGLSLLLLSLGCGMAGAQAPAAAASRAGQNIVGSVVNATTGQPLPHVPVTLVQLQGNMQPVATTTTDQAGHYRFSQTAAGPFMVQADFDGVPYFATVTAGQSETNLQVYNLAQDPALLQVDAEIMVLQPDAGQLAVVNEYRVENGLQPPRTLAASGGIFRFRVAPGAHVDMVRVVGPGEMPLARQAQPTSDPNVYRVDSPLRPGETRIQVSYRVPYGGLKAALTETPVTLPAHFEVYVPSPMSFQGAGFSQVGAQDGYKVYGTAGPAPAVLKFNVAGDAPMPAAPGAAPAGADAGAAAASTNLAATTDAGADASTPAAPVGPTPIPTFMERNLWTMLALLGLAAAAGFGILLARPGLPAADPVPPAPVLRLPPAENEIMRLKDDLFRIEIRRRTGNLDDAAYAAQRAELDRRIDRLAGAILVEAAAHHLDPAASSLGPSRDS